MVQSHYANGPGQYEAHGATGKKMLKASYPLGDRDSTVYITMERVKAKDPTVETGYRLRFDMNPRKLGLEGAKTLFQVLTSTVDVAFDFAYFLRDARFTRLDVAIDYADLLPGEAILSAKGEGKVVRYSGDDGALETIQVHRKRAKPKEPKKVIRNPLGSLIVKLYDRNRERAAHGKPPPYEGSQVTRLERTMVKKGMGQKTLFINLQAHPNPFMGVHLTLVRAACPSGMPQKQWATYCAVRQALGSVQARAITCTDVTQGDALEKAYAKSGSALLSGSYWQGWSAGIGSTGLNYLLDAAKSVPAGLP